QPGETFEMLHSFDIGFHDIEEFEEAIYGNRWVFVALTVTCQCFLLTFLFVLFNITFPENIINNDEK
ncbi:hypothetical protein ABEY61_29445, partial [Bacillus toyonensis]